MRGDSIAKIQVAIKQHLASGGPVEVDGVVSATVPWRPHLYQKSRRIGWYAHSVAPGSNFWLSRIARAREVDSKLGVGIAATEDILKDPAFLLDCYRINARLISLRASKNDYSVDAEFPSVPDYICDKRLALESSLAAEILDEAHGRALQKDTNAKMGVALEILVALLLSQVRNFEVSSDGGVSNRTQQMDVLIHNRNTSGMLGSSPLVLAEAKNWRREPLTPTEYYAFRRKLESRHGRAKLGFLVTTGKFTRGVPAEVRRDSKDGYLVVLVDGTALPKIWRGKKSITENIEHLAIVASIGE